MRPWKKLIICSVSLIVILFGETLLNFACGPEADPYDYYVSFFHNTIQKNQNYRSFYFNGLRFLNDDRNAVTEADVNSAEWVGHLGKGVLAADVTKAMYNLSLQTDSVLLLKYLKPRGKLPDSLRANTFLRTLVSGRNNDALKYYRFAKGGEPIVNSFNDRWNARQPNVKLFISKANEALKNASTEKDKFLKLRYYYQAQRLMHYAGKHREASDIYTKNIAGSKSKSHVLGWALSLNAGEEWRTGNPAKAAFLFSKLFAEYPERRIQAFHDFNNIAAKPGLIMKFAKTGKEKAFVYAIAGFHTPYVSLTALENVYKYQPTSPLVKLLLVREVNKIEEGYLSVKLDKTVHHNPYTTGYIYNFVGEDSVVKKQKAYLPKLTAFCKRLSIEGKYPERALGNITVAYIEWMQDNNTAGFKALSAINNLHLNHTMEDQKQMIRLLLIAQKIEKTNKLSKPELLLSLQWLNDKVKWEAQQTTVKRNSDDYYYWGTYDFKPYSASARDFYTKILAPAYLKQKDTAMAGLVILKGVLTIVDTNIKRRSGFSMPDFLQRKLHSYDLRKVIRCCKMTSKSGYLKLLTADMDQKIIYNLYELTGTAYLREHNYNKAVSMFTKIPPADFKNTPAYYQHVNPFIGRLHDFPTNAGPKMPPGYIKLQFAKKMVVLERLIKANPQKASWYYYQVANGLYSTSIDGSAWEVIAYTLARYDIDRKRTEYYDADFLNASNAEKYYIKARSLSKSKDFKARCTFMAAKCRQSQLIYPPFPDYEHNDKEFDKKYNLYEKQLAAHNQKYRKNYYFTELKYNYSKTDFYKIAINECSYFRDFLAAGKPFKKAVKRIAATK